MEEKKNPQIKLLLSIADSNVKYVIDWNGSMSISAAYALSVVPAAVWMASQAGCSVLKDLFGRKCIRLNWLHISNW